MAGRAERWCDHRPHDLVVDRDDGRQAIVIAKPDEP